MSGSGHRRTRVGCREGRPGCLQTVPGRISHRPVARPTGPSGTSSPFACWFEPICPGARIASSARGRGSPRGGCLKWP